MPDSVTKNRITGSIMATGGTYYCEIIANMLNTAYQTNEYFVEPWDDDLAADFLGASHGG